MVDPSQIDWQFFIKRLKAQKAELVPAFTFAILAAVSQGAIAWLVGSIFNATFLTSVWEKREVLFICLGTVLLIAFSSITDSLHKYFLRSALEKMAQKLRIDIFSRFLVFSESTKGRLDSGAAINHVVTDVQLLSEARHFITEVIKEPLTLFVLLGYLFYLNWRLCLICFVAIIPIVLVIKILGQSAKRNQKRVQAQLSDVITSINENFQGMRTVHTFLLEKRVLTDFRILMQDLVAKLLKIARIEESVGPVIKIVSAIAGAFLIYAGAYFVSFDKSITSVDLVRFLTAAGLMQAPLRNMSNAGVQLQRISAGALRVLMLFNIVPDQLSNDQEKLLVEEKTYAIPSHPLSLQLTNVSFSYPHPKLAHNHHSLAIDDLTFALEPGKKLALVGKSGSGKTTLSLLALRLIDPTMGTIALGSKDIRQWDLGEYRSYFSYVSQEVYFFQGTIRENFQKISASVTDAQIMNALEMAQLKDKIAGLPLGIDTPLTEKGANLSGGERQRLAIARAILRNSPILILDEATSNLDSENEELIQQALEHLLNEKSAIIVAHRLSTVLNCDEILVFDKGKIVERGAPRDLRKADSNFSKMWAIQQGEKHT